MPKKPIIDKEMFKRSVLYNVKTLYRKTLEEATEIGRASCRERV